MNIFKNFRLTTKIVFIIVFLTLSFSSLIGFYIVPVITNTLEKDSETKLKNLTETSYKIVEFYYNQSQKGVYAEAQAKDLAKETILNLRYESNEYFWINDYTPVMIMHPTSPELDGKNLSNIKDPDGLAIFDEFVKVAKTKKEGLVRYQWPKPGSDKSEPKFSYVKAFEPWQWIVGTGIYVGDLAEIRNGIVFKIIISVLSVIIITLILVTIFVLKPLNKTIHRILAYLEELSHYNFSKGIDLKQKDELGIIADSFNYIVENVRSLIKDTKDLGDLVVNESTQMISSTEEITIASERTANTITDLASGANEQAISTTNSTEKLQGMVNRLDTINQDISSSGDLAHKATESVRIGSELVKDQGNKIANNKSVYTQIGNSISSLADKSKEINDIVLVIQGIAGQTNLLALNAAIEAARAGEHGRGFAVVAEEVRKLAEQVDLSGTKVINIVSEVEAGIDTTASHMALANKAVEEEEESLKKIVVFFQEISDSIRTIQEKIEAISHNSNEINKEAKSASDEISRIAVISKKSAQGTEDVAALSEETSATIQEVSERVKKLASYAEELKQSIGKFKVE
ncbi:MAG: methyl-accepting chemotaxis protein [Selenomonadaceae bacterium]